MDDCVRPAGDQKEKLARSHFYELKKNTVKPFDEIQKNSGENTGRKTKKSS